MTSVGGVMDHCTGDLIHSYPLDWHKNLFFTSNITLQSENYNYYGFAYSHRLALQISRYNTDSPSFAKPMDGKSPLPGICLVVEIKGALLNMSQLSIDASTAQHLRQFIEKVERLEEEKAAIADHIRDVFAEAKSQGFDVKVIREILKLRKMKDNDREELEHLLAVYLHAIEQQSTFSEGAREDEAA